MSAQYSVGLHAQLLPGVLLCGNTTPNNAGSPEQWMPSRSVAVTAQHKQGIGQTATSATVMEPVFIGRPEVYASVALALLVRPHKD